MSYFKGDIKLTGTLVDGAIAVDNITEQTLSAGVTIQNNTVIQDESISITNSSATIMALATVAATFLAQGDTDDTSDDIGCYEANSRGNKRGIKLCSGKTIYAIQTGSLVADPQHDFYIQTGGTYTLPAVGTGLDFTTGTQPTSAIKVDGTTQDVTVFASMFSNDIQERTALAGVTLQNNTIIKDHSIVLTGVSTDVFSKLLGPTGATMIIQGDIDGNDTGIGCFDINSKGAKRGLRVCSGSTIYALQTGSLVADPQHDFHIQTGGTYTDPGIGGSMDFATGSQPTSALSIDGANQDISIYTNLLVDNILEKTATNGVDIDGVLAKDGGVTLLTTGGTATSLDYFEEFVGDINWTGPWSGGVTISLKATRVGNQVTITMPPTAVTGDTDTVATCTDIPSRFLPASIDGSPIHVPVIIRDGLVKKFGVARLNSSQMIIGEGPEGTGGLWKGSAIASGFPQISFSYRLY